MNRVDINTVLVLGISAESPCMEELFGLGLVPIRRSHIGDAIHLLRHGRFVAAVVDFPHTTEDTLEFVLNVRDLNPGIPVLVAGPFRQPLDNQTILKNLGVDIVERQRDFRRMMARSLAHLETAGES